MMANQERDGACAGPGLVTMAQEHTAVGLPWYIQRGSQVYAVCTVAIPPTSRNTYHPDTLQCEDDSGEVERDGGVVTHCIALRGGRHPAQHEHEADDDADEDQEVGQHGGPGEVLQVPHQDEQHDERQDAQNVNPQVKAVVTVILHDLRTRNGVHRGEPHSVLGRHTLSRVWHFA